MSTKIIGTCSICRGPVAVIEPWLGTYPCVPTCQSCGARKKNAYGPVIEMEPYKGLPGTILPVDPRYAPIDWKLGSPTCGNNAFKETTTLVVDPKDSASFVEAVKEAINVAKNRTA